MKIEIFPLEKITIDGATILLGDARSNVEAAIGNGQVIGKSPLLL